MIDKQPEALQLADIMEQKAKKQKTRLGDYWTDDWCFDAAAELRRLHQSEREGWRYANELEQERKRLHEVNAELVEALGTVIRGVPNTWDGVQKAKVVLDKAKESNHG